MSVTKKSLLGSYYERHHETGNRLRQSFMEDTRGALFRDWIGTGKKVLDLGGRDGVLTRSFAAGNEVIVGDIDTSAMEHARKEYGLGTVEVDMNNPLPLPDESFDVVVMAEVLEHLPYPTITLTEAQRILRAGGLFIGSIPVAYHLMDRWKVLRGKKLTMAGDPTHLQFFTYDELLALLARFFEVDEIQILKGGQKAEKFPRLFARDIAFRCTKRTV